MWLRGVATVALRGPGKALLAVSAAGWVAIAWVMSSAGEPHSGLAVPGTHHPGRAHSLQPALVMWLLMVLAMAPPLLLREIGRLWRGSLRRMRYLTVTSFACAYTTIWLLAGVALTVLATWMTVSGSRVAVAIALTALWHVTPVRQRCLNACHRAPALRVFGTAALRDAMRYGASAGAYCVATCGPLMLLVLLFEKYHLVAMVVAAAVTTRDRYVSARPPGWQLPLFRSRSTEPPYGGIDRAVFIR